MDTTLDYLDSESESESDTESYNPKKFRERIFNNFTKIICEAIKNKKNIYTVIDIQNMMLEEKNVNKKLYDNWTGIDVHEKEIRDTFTSFLKSLDNMSFSQSTVGKATRKSLETATTNVIEKLIKNGVFEN